MRLWIGSCNKISLFLISRAKEYALKMGKDLDPIGAYAVSKVWAEEAVCLRASDTSDNHSLIVLSFKAWEFMKAEKPSFDITTILPPLVCGPILQPGTSPNTLNTSNFELWHLLTGIKEDVSAFAKNNPTIPTVDVRDVSV